MKKFLLILLTTFTSVTNGQVICVQCYNQNAHVFADTSNLILNGGFEQNTCIPNDFFNSSFCPNSAYYSCNISNWVCTGGGSNTYADMVDGNTNVIIEGTESVYFGNNLCNACSSTMSDTSCLSNIGCTVTGVPIGYPDNPYAGFGADTGLSLSQTVNGLVPGSMYILEFWAGGEWSVIYLFNGLFAVDVGFGNIFLRNPTVPFSGTGIRYVIVFNATSTSHTIKFTNWGHIAYNGSGLATELVLDDVWLFQPPSGNNPCATAINELNKNDQVRLLPNPFHSTATLELSAEFANSQLNIYNSFGEQVKQMKINSELTIINRNGLSDGIYFYQIRNSKGNLKSAKFIVE